MRTFWGKFTYRTVELVLRQPMEKIFTVSFCSPTCDRDLTSALQQKQCLEALLGSEALFAASLQTLRPEFLRMAPPLLPCPQAACPSTGLVGCLPDDPELWAEELTWLSPPTVEHTFHWDESMGQSAPMGEVCWMTFIAWLINAKRDVERMP